MTNWKGSLHDIIVAPATPQGQSAIAIVRISGDGSIELVDKIFKGKKKLSGLKGYSAAYGWIIDPESKKEIDEAVALVFKKPHSYTGEDMVELSVHGSPLIVAKVVRLITRLGARPAEPGEFTFRAVANKRIDLTRAEAINELIRAQNERALELALRQLKGELYEAVKKLREQLIKFISLLELELDFSEEDVEFASRTELKQLLNRLREQISRLAESYKAGNAIKNGIPITIVGRPNAGKSTLFNRLIGEERAIVTDIPGTTRDYLEVLWNIEGYQIRLIDTAGLRKTSDPVERIGIERAKEQIKRSFLSLYIFDVSTMTVEEAVEDVKQLSRLQSSWLLLANKIDLLSTQQMKELQEKLSRYPNLVLVSARTGWGIDDLQSRIVNTIIKEWDLDAPVLLNERHHALLNEALEALEEVIEAFEQNQPAEIVSSLMRRVTDILGELTGEITSEDILSEIFANFCIGK